MALTTHGHQVRGTPVDPFWVREACSLRRPNALFTVFDRSNQTSKQYEDQFANGLKLEEMDRCARAYGYEVGRGHALVEKIEELSPDNPFLDPNWRERIQ